MAGLMDLVNISIKLYFEIRDSEMYGGVESIGYSSTEFNQCRTPEYFTEEHIQAIKKDVAKMLNITADKVRMISKEEYDLQTADDDPDGDFAVEW